MSLKRVVHTHVTASLPLCNMLGNSARQQYPLIASSKQNDTVKSPASTQLCQITLCLHWTFEVNWLCTMSCEYDKYIHTRSGEECDSCQMYCIGRQEYELAAYTHELIMGSTDRSLFIFFRLIPPKVVMITHHIVYCLDRKKSTIACFPQFPKWAFWFHTLGQINIEIVTRP